MTCFCDQTSYEPLLRLAPVAGSVTSEGGGQSAGLAVVAAIVFGLGGWLLGTRSSRRRERRAAGDRGVRPVR